jgi:carboxymethylenebutenolidase
MAVHAVHTDAEGLDARAIKIPAGDVELPGYQAMPARGAAFPVILVVQEIFGVNEHIQDVCRRLAKLGYLAIAPELFWRQGDVSKMQDYREISEKVASKVGDAQVLADLDATADYTGAGRGDLGRLGITGFCWGGRIAWLYAAHTARLRAAVAWYGRLTGERDELRPWHPVDVAGKLCCPVLGLYGAQDQAIPLETVEQMRTAIAAAKKNAEIIVYPEAGHAFHADYRPSYNQNAARDAWQRMREWFRQYGVA